MFPKELYFVTAPEKMKDFFRFLVTKSALYVIFKTHFNQGCVWLSYGEDSTAETKTPTMTFNTTFNVTLLFFFFFL